MRATCLVTIQDSVLAQAVQFISNAKEEHDMLEFIGHGLFLVLGIIIGASIMYFGEMLIDRFGGDEE